MSERFCRTCGTARPEKASFCAICGSAFDQPAGTPTPAATASPQPVSSPSALTSVPRAGLRPGKALWGALAATTALVVVLVVVLTRPDSTSESDTTTLAPAVSTSTSTSTVAPVGGEVVLETLAVEIPDVFMTDMSRGEQPLTDLALPTLGLPTTTTSVASSTSAPTSSATTTPPSAVALTSVAGSTPGLYGGTRDMVACDQPAMISYLEANPDKAAAWAGVQGIDPADIRPFIEGLTPLVLTRDTRVTNHGFVDGRAFAHQSVLQAGHAVLVDEFGVPRSKCSCGNPLAPPQPVTSTPTYVGEPWAEFDISIVVVVVATQPVRGGFVVIDTAGGKPFVRPVGMTTTDGDLATDILCDLFPTDPLCQPEPTTTDTPTTTGAPSGPPTGEVVVIADVTNVAGVLDGATAPFEFTLTEPVYVVTAYTYHWNGARGRAPGEITFVRRDGLTFGPFAARGSDGQGGVPNAYWTVEPGVVLPPGNYELIDSDPTTWSQNAGTGGVGMGQVRGIVVPAADVGPVDEAGVAAITIIDMLLLDCGTDVDGWVDGGTVPGGRLVSGRVEGRWVGFVVNRPLGTWSVSPTNQRSADIAVACGFYSP